MSRSLSDLHPWLRARVAQLLTDYAAAALARLDEEGTLSIAQTTRTAADQAAAFEAGRSSLDGVHRWSLHQYEPALACDLVPCLGARASWGEITEREKARWSLLGELAEGLGLEWGGRWRRPHDAPHVQVPERQRIRLLQQALEARGRSPGPADGLLGPRTLAALRGLEAAAGLALTERALWWSIRPASWAAAHVEALGPTV